MPSGYVWLFGGYGRPDSGTSKCLFKMICGGTTLQLINGHGLREIKFINVSGVYGNRVQRGDTNNG
jgi:hypothetical protein